MKSIKEREKIFSAQEMAELLQEVIHQGASFRFRARGWSMTPFIQDGDILTITPCPNAKLKIGQMVAVLEREQNSLLVHRIVGKKGSNYLVKGDNLLSPDGLFSAAEILGVVAKIERGKRVLFPQGSIRPYLIACFSRHKGGMSLISWARRLGRVIKKGRKIDQEKR